MDRSSDAPWRYFQVGSVLLVLGLFLVSLSGLELGGLLTPFVLFWVLVVVLLPFKGSPGRSVILVAAACLTVLQILNTTGVLLAPFFLALVLSYVLDPLVDRVEGPRVGRSLAIVILSVPVLFLLALGVVVGIPALGEQVGELIQRTPDLLQRLADWFQALQERASGIDLPFIDEDALETRLRNVDADVVIAFLDERKEAIFSGIWDGVLGLGRGIGSVISILGYVVLTPVLTFYLLRDFDGLKAWLKGLLPASGGEEILDIATEYDGLLGRYLRGQLTVALISGSFTALGLLVLGFPNAIFLGFLVTIFSVIPYLGMVLSLLPAIFLALVSGNVLLSLLKIAVVYSVAQGLESAVVSPKIVGDSVGLHPVLVVLALAVGGYFLGFVGLLIGVPLAVGAKILVVRGLDHYRHSGFYLGKAGAES